ncbi:TIGR04282 family arsenosugar biosynthesis glycosyltransferase [Pacificimonas flava]|uniref:Glycosyltransferase n=1 Tax=Pacificimonas flava TaxID=1234595 RepID=M2SE22_9SPHN|nr:TIGR04282 family arsenosugar biosynthesis glycosyltransferase [Pacificimonas flava]EMD83610.1 hypothetical protein C725_0582 [Pacificimonas flava]MBB5280706.1 hypothetical protein [Pacificimonas flava]
MTRTLRPIIFARYPRPGRCKTRLEPELGAHGAAALHGRLVMHTLSALAPLAPRLAFTGAEGADVRAWLGGDVDILEQAAGDLGERLLVAMARPPALIVGSDIPDIDAAAVESAARHLFDHDLVLGPAEDGGFWLIGARDAPPPTLFDHVAWGTSTVLEQVEANAAALRLSVARAKTLADLDRPQDLERWPQFRPT